LRESGKQCALQKEILRFAAAALENKKKLSGEGKSLRV
jgi:hypothetical protein